MKDESRLPIRCTAIDPNLENGGRDDWRADIARAYPELFDPPRGLPECGEGWRHLIEQACSEIRAALKENATNVLKVTLIKQRYGVLNIFWEGALSGCTRTAVERAIECAYVESAQTCESCGFEGRLYTCAGWLITACTGHGKGKPAPWKRKAAAVRVVHGMIGGERQILSCRQYDRECDCFADVPPDGLEISVEELLSQSERHHGGLSH
ncbi:hypothetical protein [Bradyrhizobium tropiciagri]|uniref:hypothetical protein n=1 Tax=Bradyrhizobium tropiciagri TaxID=312253 RepID=UPI000A9501BD|nr:hypothetical protein [Bradyrhizobium tropiciagri]